MMAKLEFEEGSAGIVRCSAGHVQVEYDYYHNEKAHKAADEAMYQRMKQLDPEFATWYQSQRGDWWYS